MRVSETRRRLPEMEDLTGLEWDLVSDAPPRLTVVVPARDEAENIEATLRALLLADYPGLDIGAVTTASKLPSSAPSIATLNVLSNAGTLALSSRPA